MHANLKCFLNMAQLAWILAATSCSLGIFHSCQVQVLFLDGTNAGNVMFGLALWYIWGVLIENFASCFLWCALAAAVLGHALDGRRRWLGLMMFLQAGEVTIAAI